METDNKLCFETQLLCLWDITAEMLSGKLDGKEWRSKERKGLKHRFGCLLQRGDN